MWHSGSEEERSFFSILQMYLIYYLPLEKIDALYLNKPKIQKHSLVKRRYYLPFKNFEQMCITITLLVVWSKWTQLFLKGRFSNVARYYLPLKGDVALNWTIFNPFNPRLGSASFSWNWLNGSEEGDKNGKFTDRRTTSNRRLEKLTRTFSYPIQRELL